jgi:hypothetical protein
MLHAFLLSGCVNFNAPFSLIVFSLFLSGHNSGPRRSPALPYDDSTGVTDPAVVDPVDELGRRPAVGGHPSVENAEAESVFEVVAHATIANAAAARIAGFTYP